MENVEAHKQRLRNEIAAYRRKMQEIQAELDNGGEAPDPDPNVPEPPDHDRERLERELKQYQQLVWQKETELAGLG